MLLTLESVQNLRGYHVADKGFRPQEGATKLIRFTSNK